MKWNLWNSFQPCLLPSLNFNPNFLHLFLTRGVGGWRMGLWLIHHTSLLLLFPQGQDSSHSSPALVRGPSLGTQLSMNISSVGPSHRVQSFRTTLWFAHMTSPASKPVPAQAHSPAGGSLPHSVPLCVARFQPASPCSAAQAEISAPCLEHLLPHCCFHWSWCPQCYCSCTFSLLFLAAVAVAQQFFPLLKSVTPALLMGFGQQWGHLLLTEAIPVPLQIQCTSPSNTTAFFFRLSTVQI